MEYAICRKCKSFDIALIKTERDICLDEIILFNDCICLRCGNRVFLEQHEGKELFFKYKVIEQQY